MRTHRRPGPRAAWVSAFALMAAACSGPGGDDGAARASEDRATAAAQGNVAGDAGDGHEQFATDSDLSLALSEAILDAFAAAD